MENDDYRNRFAFIAVILLLCAYGITRFPTGDADSSFGFETIPLGIDLEGGAELTYTARMSVEPDSVPDIMARTVTVIANRIDPAGTSSYSVTSAGKRVLITMGGATSTETQRVQRLLNKSGRLEMRLELRDGGYRSEDLNTALTARREGRDNPIEGTHWYSPKRGAPILIEDHAYITGNMLSKAIGEPVGNGFNWKVSLIFDQAKGGVEGLRQISKIAFENNSSGMAIVLNDLWTEKEVDGKTVRTLVKQGICDSSPSVQAEFGNGMCEITGNYTKSECDDLVALLDSGSLPVEIVPESSVIIGPTLGEASIKNGKMSCLLGLVLIFIFMLVYYGQLGWIANLCLTINLFIIWFVMAKFNFVLTLPGIAGVLLTIGMAVDANVLIFERIKEELRQGHPMARAIQTGYEKAFVAIFDANLTTFLTGMILYLFGSGPVKGFAVTLCAGILASMFSAIYVSRAVVDWLLETGRLKNASTKRLYSGQADFLGGIQKLMAVVSVVAVCSGLTYVFSKGEDTLGMDFRGGTRLQIAFIEPQDKLEIADQGQQALDNHAWTDKEGTDRTFDFKGDLKVVPIRGTDQDPDAKLYNQFILKTKNFENEEVERAFITAFGDRLRAKSLVENQNTDPLKFIKFTFTAVDKFDSIEMRDFLRQKLSDPGLIAVPAKDNGWTVLISPGRSLDKLQGFLAGALGERLQPENIQWKPNSQTEVVISLTSVQEIKSFIDEFVLAYAE